MRFSSLKQMTFSDIAVGQSFWLPKPGHHEEMISRMSQLQQLTKTRLSARRLGRSDVDGNVIFVTAVNTQGKEIFCAADDAVFCEVKNETGE